MNSLNKSTREQKTPGFLTTSICKKLRDLSLQFIRRVPFVEGNDEQRKHSAFGNDQLFGLKFRMDHVKIL